MTRNERHLKEIDRLNAVITEMRRQMADMSDDLVDTKAELADERRMVEQLEEQAQRFIKEGR